MKKPLHKHIGQQAKKVGGHFTKYLYERDTLFATLWVFIFIVVLGSIPLNLGIMNPVKLGLKDFDFNDISYSKLGKSSNTEVDKDVVIINIGQADREGLAQLIEKTSTYQPKVIGLDVTFDGPRDPVKDSLMREAIRKNRNLVLAVKYMVDTTKDKLVPALNYFLDSSTAYGYVNFPNDDKETIRSYFPYVKDEKDEKIVLPSFSTALLKIYAPEKARKLEKKVSKKMLINYTRKVTPDKKQYQVMEPEDLLNDNVDSAAIRGKIALLAYVSTNPNDIEDKKFSPMNEKFAGKSIPDMNGIVVHANIISMVLEENYIKKVPLWLNLLIAVIVCWLHMSFFVRYYLESHIWFHLAAKIAQVLSSLFFVWLGIYLFDRYRLKVDLKYSLITIIMAVDVIYFYEAWAVWMHKRFNYRTVFKPHHH